MRSKRNWKMLSKEELFAMTSEQVFQAILNGKISFEQFDNWRQNLVEENREEAYNNGYDSGYDTGHDSGYESAQEYYGDGPSS